MVSVPDTSRVSPMVEPLSRPYRSNAKVLRARLQDQDRSDDLRHQPTAYALRLRLVPARGRVLEEQPDALAALLPGPVVARLLPIAQHFDLVRHARAVCECDPGVHGRVPIELTPEDRARSLRSQRSCHMSDEASVNRSTTMRET